MRSIVAAILLVLTILGSGLTTAPTSAQTTATLVGTIKSARSIPVAGLEVFLVHPQVGRSTPVYTDASGQFRIFGVPPIEDPYFLEVYWGADLVYWSRVQVKGHTQLPEPIIVGT